MDETLKDTPRNLDTKIKRKIKREKKKKKKENKKKKVMEEEKEDLVALERISQ
jgi:GTP cyclohydrolase I